MKKNMCAVDRPYSEKRSSFSHFSNSIAFIYLENFHHNDCLCLRDAKKKFFLVCFHYLFIYLFLQIKVNVIQVKLIISQI